MDRGRKGHGRREKKKGGGNRGVSPPNANLYYDPVI